MTEPRQRDWSPFADLPEWHDEAKCKGSPNSWWFPDVGKGSLREVQRARRICFTCPVREECLSYAVETNQNNGIWGGLNVRERRKVRKERVA